MEELEKLRREISAVDARLVPLLKERMEISGQIGAYKRAHGSPVLDAAREEKVLREVSRSAGAETEKYLREIYRKIMEMSRLYQTEEKP